jgi:O-antigen/teichoic acid export membrane protein
VRDHRLDFEPHFADRKQPGNGMASVARDSFFNFFANGVRVVLSFITTVLLARCLGANNFGEINLIIGYTVFLHYFLALGFDHTLAYYLPKFNVDGRPWLAREVLRVALLTSSAMAVVLIGTGVLALPPILRAHGAGQFVLPGIIIATQNWLSAMGAILGGYLRGAKDFRALITKDQILFPAAHLVLSALAIAWLHGGVLTYAWVFALANCIALVYGLWVTFTRISPREPSPKRREFRERRRWLSFSIPIALTGAIEPLLPWGTIMVLGWFLTPSDVGKFSVSFRVAVFIQFFLLAVGPIFAPYLSEHFQRREMSQFKTLYQSVNFFSGLWSAVLASVFFISGDLILKLFGREYSGATALLGILLAANFLEGAFGAIKQSLIMSGKSRVNLVNISVAVALNFSLCIWLIPRLGVVGAAYGNLFGYLAMNLMRCLEFYLVFRIAPYNREQFLFLGAVIAGLCSLCLWTYGGALSMAARIGIVAAILLLSGLAALPKLLAVRGGRSAEKVLA